MPKEDKAKIKMTVIHFETESANATLQENIRSIAQTLARALTPPSRPSSQLITHPANGIKQAGSSSSVVQNEEEEENNALDDVGFEQQPSTSTSGSKTGSARQYRTPQPIDIDLISGPMPLKAFLEKANPEGDVKRYLAIAFWMKEYRKTGEISMDHAYTCYRCMGTGWNVPPDASKPFRSMKSKSYGWMKAGTTRGFFAINHLGENVIREMIG